MKVKIGKTQADGRRNLTLVTRLPGNSEVQTAAIVGSNDALTDVLTAVLPSHVKKVSDFYQAVATKLAEYSQDTAGGD